MRIHVQRPHTRSRSTRGGFALVIALSLMAFVLLLLLGMVALTQVETQTASSTLRMNEARANAILGLQVGLGELQRLSGPDTRVTARAEILGLDDSSPYRYWTGVWDSRDADPDTARMDHSARRAYDPSDRKTGVAWLVSGLDGERPEEIDPELIKIPADQQVELMSGDSDENIPEVIAGKQTIANAPTQNSGSYAWWVGDEGVKARIDEIQAGLPRRTLEDGTVSQVTLAPVYDRTGLIHETLGTLSTALWQQLLVTLLVVLVMLRSLRGSVVIGMVLPLGVLFASPSTKKKKPAAARATRASTRAKRS